MSAKPVQTHKSPTAAELVSEKPFAEAAVAHGSSSQEATGQIGEATPTAADPDALVSEEPHRLPTDAESISKQLLAKVDSLFENFNRFPNIEYFKAAEEWKTLNGFFRDTGERYAIASHTEDDRRAWVWEKLRSDRDAIQHAARVFCILQSRRFGVGIEEVRGVLEKTLGLAMGEGMSEARAYIGESEASHRKRRPSLEVADKAQKVMPSLPAAQSSLEVHNEPRSREAIKPKSPLILIVGLRIRKLPSTTIAQLRPSAIGSTPGS